MRWFGPRSNRLAAAACAFGLWLGGWVLASAAAPKFYPDDPLQREPETQDASKVAEWDILLTYDLLQNLLTTRGDTRDQRARNVNTIDEVPDSNWFTNRVLARPMSTAELMRGPQTGNGPAAGVLTLIRPKSAGVTPGFVARDAGGVTWFIQFDAPGHDEAASAASMVANKIFYALGYWQTENYLAEIRPGDVRIGDNVMLKLPDGRRRPFRRADLDEIFTRSARRPDGAYRMLASRALSGRPIGGFRYDGTRPDDPNDIVPHEHRRELRALHVFGAWTNLVDMKAGNTLDVVVEEGGKSVVRHYLQDVGSTFGTGALGPHAYEEGYEHLLEPDTIRKRLLTLGFFLRPWQRIPYDEHPAIGRFEGDRFDPREWKPRAPTAALARARADDHFWAARRVMAFSDEMIRAMVKTGGYTDPDAERLLADVLIKRRDRIGRTYLPAINPVVDPALAADGTLKFTNAAVEAGVAPAPREYRIGWFAFNNATNESRAIGETTSGSTSATAPRSAIEDTSADGLLRVDIDSVAADYPSWAEPVHAYFRRGDVGWKLVGLERMD